MLYVVNIAKGQHGKKEIREALRYAEDHGWSVEPTAAGHRWGVARCGAGCSVSIWSTPKNPGNFAKKIRRAVDGCDHDHEDPTHD